MPGYAIKIKFEAILPETTMLTVDYDTETRFLLSH